jgi:hypothetical protein
VSQKINAFFSALTSLILFTAIPLLVPSYLPAHILDYAGRIGIDLTLFVNQLAIMGCAVSILTFLKSYFSQSSPINLLASLASSGLTFAFTIVTLSLGKISQLGTLGLTNLDVEVQGSINAISLDFRFLVQLTALTVILKMVEAVFGFVESRKELMVLDK